MFWKEIDAFFIILEFFFLYFIFFFSKKWIDQDMSLIDHEQSRQKYRKRHSKQ